MKTIPKIKLPIIQNGKISNQVLSEIMSNKNIIIFGVPGAFTPTCSEKHFPSFLKFFDQIKDKGINDIYCLSVNDAFVMKAWLKTFPKGNLINGIADGNADFVKKMNLVFDYSSHFMGYRSSRFSLISKNNFITNFNVEKKGEFIVSSGDNILKQL